MHGSSPSRLPRVGVSVTLTPEQSNRLDELIALADQKRSPRQAPIRNVNDLLLAALATLDAVLTPGVSVVDSVFTEKTGG